MRYTLKNRFYIFLIGLIDFIAGIIFLPFKLFKKRKPGNIGNILLIRLDHIGDLISSTPVPQNLKNHYKGAKITFLVADWAKEVIMNNPYIDEVICYNAPWFDRSKKRIFEFIRFFKLAGELRKYNYDLGFDLRGDVRHVLLMLLAGVRFRVGYGITGGGFMLHKEVEYRHGGHSTEHNLDLLRGMNIDIVTEKPVFYISEKDELSIIDFLKKNGLTENDRIAVLHPYAGYPSKNWLDTRFAELIEVLYRDYKAKIILIGSKKDKERIDNIIELGRVGAINAVGKTSLGAVLALIKKSFIFIGCDSGPAHIAALADKPSVILYSGTNSPEEWGPRNKKTAIIQKEISCKGCQRLDCEANICMDLISVDDVLEAAEQVLKR